MRRYLSQSRGLPALAGLWLSLAIAGCSDDEEELDVDACEHLQEGPAVPTASGGTVADDHRRYDLALTPAANPSAIVTFVSMRDDDYFVFLSEDVPLTVRRVAGSGIDRRDFVQGSDDCNEVDTRSEFHLDVGTYELIFGSTAETLVSIVVEGKNAPDL
jgi:hypothetical protein